MMKFPTYKEMGKKIAEEALDGYIYKGKTLRAWIDILAQAQWIPVSERLPETDGVYIVTRRLFDNQIDTEPYYMVDACYFDGSNTWHDDNRINYKRSYLTDIISWMPLPESYKGE